MEPYVDLLESVDWHRSQYEKRQAPRKRFLNFVTNTNLFGGSAVLFSVLHYMIPITWSNKGFMIPLVLISGMCTFSSIFFTQKYSAELNDIESINGSYFNLEENILGTISKIQGKKFDSKLSKSETIEEYKNKVLQLKIDEIEASLKDY
jgi:hypothetical protein